MRGKTYSDVRQPTCKRWNIHSAEKKITLPKFMPFNRLWSNRTNGKAITLENCSIENLQENKMEIRQPENGD
jgi:hypothetical protein